MRVIVTRPAAEASEWVLKLQAQGIDAVALPLIEIQFAEPDLDGPDGPAACTALMFVSPNAVRGFFKEKDDFPVVSSKKSATESVANFSDQTRAWATGPGTRQALLDAHWPPDLIDTPPPDAAQWDARALWPVVQDQVQDGMQVLVVQGQSDAGGPSQPLPQVLAGSAWLIEALHGRGARVHTRVVYRRQMPTFTSAQRDMALAAGGAGAIWLMTSSEAIAHLRRWLPCTSWAQAQAIVTHPRIAQAAREAGFGQVTVCKPLLSEVVASIESFA